MFSMQSMSTAHAYCTSIYISQIIFNHFKAIEFENMEFFTFFKMWVSSQDKNTCLNMAFLTDFIILYFYLQNINE